MSGGWSSTSGRACSEVNWLDGSRAQEHLNTLIWNMACCHIWPDAGTTLLCRNPKGQHACAVPKHAVGVRPPAPGGGCLSTRPARVVQNTGCAGGKMAEVHSQAPVSVLIELLLCDI